MELMAIPKRNFLIVSKNKRSEALFRRCWAEALGKHGEVTLLNRECDSFCIFDWYRKLLRTGDLRRLFFGVTEIALAAPISKPNDVWIFTGLGRLLMKKGFSRSLTTCYLRIFYKGQKIVVLNQTDMRVLQKIFKEGARINKVDGEGFKFAEQSKSTAENNKICFVGRLLKSKGVDELIETFSKFDSKIELHVYGDSDANSMDAVSGRVIDEIKYKSNNIKFHGYSDNVKNELQKYRYYISLSRREGLPFSVLEAIEAGCYILLSKVTGHYAFRKLAGVHLFQRAELEELLAQISMGLRFQESFDVNERLRSASQKFGPHVIQNIVEEIANEY